MHIPEHSVHSNHKVIPTGFKFYSCPHFYHKAIPLGFEFALEF